MLQSLIRILRASLVQIDTEMAEKYAKRYHKNNNQRSAVDICRTMCVSINGPGLVTLTSDLLTLKLVR